MECKTMDKIKILIADENADSRRSCKEALLRAGARNVDEASNGEEAGTKGYAYRMEAVEIQVLPKNSDAPGSTDIPYAKGRRIAGRLVYETSASKGKMIVLDPGHAMHIPAGSEPNAPGSGAMKAKDTYGTFGYASGLPEGIRMG